ncbi:transcriptional regulator with XRE-family HTH domain [Pseudarthrobacter defluvii]|uniref:Transcriptional regulator with XRE-family HTH domain n=1 Tax=Pseudarthrobacter defluvii TaxID=410837 RepID=A0ABT9UGT4_9MICC|nr:helix-turn-helix transcriptional regulator [Pseudarthrobacter defluvii]MDQ0117444.1 transcriptional regulator with XRE-family HTH domain [Pseudarthrobacter defluvii]
MMEEENATGPEGIEGRVVEALIDLREERGWSQSELARRMTEAGWPKYTQMTVSRTEKGERPIRLNEAEALAQVFGIEMFELWLPRKLRRYSTELHEVEKRQAQLRKDVLQLISRQETVARLADAVDLAQDEVGYAFAVLSEVPEVIVAKARAKLSGASERDLEYLDRFKPKLQKAVEEQIWPQGEELPTSLQHYMELLSKKYLEASDGERSEEA